MLTRIRQFRMQRAHARQRVFGAACVAAANDGDLDRAAVFLSRMHDAQEERDYLRAVLAGTNPPPAPAPVPEDWTLQTR